jgi:hypothetical protein
MRADPDELSRPQDFERFQYIRQESQQIVEIRGAGPNDQQRDRAASQTLLVRHVLIHRDQRFEASLIRRG